MKPDRDTLEEYFEYKAEEFLVNLALLITEGRTPEYSVKGRTEGFHCPPSQPVTTRHECSDKLPQCRRARHTRSEVTLLWKNDLPIMVEVMLLPDCCYSDEGPTTDGNDLKDPAIKQDALLLERWILEPVPRQSGDRFIEEKTLLLAVRSFVFFSQLSAWLSVSQGTVPRNILYRVSAAHVDLQCTFSQAPTEHFFPIPNVSQNVALKVSVQSLPRQSNYPVLTCSIHTSFGFWERTLEEHDGHQHREFIKATQHHRPTIQHCYGKPRRTDGALGAKKGPEFGTAVKTLKLHPLSGLGPDFGETESKLQCCAAAVDNKKILPETSESAAGESHLHNSCQSLGETVPLIGSLFQERHEIIARIAQRLTHCDPIASPLTGRPFASPGDTGLVNTKVIRNANEEESLRKKGPELSSGLTANVELPSSDSSSSSSSVRKAHFVPATPLCDSPVAATRCSPQSAEQGNPLISSLLQERQEVIARIVRCLIHCDPPASHPPCPVFNVHESGSGNPKDFRSSWEGDKLLEKAKEVSSDPFSNSRWILSEDRQKTIGKTLVTPSTSFRYDAELKVPPTPQGKGKLLLSDPCEIGQTTFPQCRTNRTCMNQSRSKCEQSKLTDTVDISDGPHKPQVLDEGIAKQCHLFSSSKALIAKDRTVVGLNNPPLDQSKTRDNMKVAVTQVPDRLPKRELQSLNKDCKPPNICEQNSQLTSIENYFYKDHDNFNSNNKQDKGKCRRDENEDPTDCEAQRRSPRNPAGASFALCERKRNTNMLMPTPTPLKHHFPHVDGAFTKPFHPRTGLPLLSSPVPERKTRSGCFDLDASLLQLKYLSSTSSQESNPYGHEKPFLSSSAPPVTSLSLLGNFEESVLNYRFDPLGIVDGFTAEVGASGVFCPTHMTLPVEVSFYSVSDDNAPSPYMGVIALESLGKRGYRVPPSGTIQVTLFNPNKTVVKMFVVIYDLREMPANHQTFLRQRTFSIPVRREAKRNIKKDNTRHTNDRLLRYLIHLRFQSSKSGKIYLYRDVRLLFSRKSMEVDSGAAYELKSYTESPTNPQFSPRC